MDNITSLTFENNDGVLKEKPDSISSEAIGGASVDDLPPNYFWSYKFIGSFIVGHGKIVLGINLN